MCDIKYYSNNQPPLLIQEIITGKISTYGYIANRKGRVIRRFTADMLGEWQENKGNLKEYFVYDNGAKVNREWQFQLIDEHHFTATAPDVIGVAKGEQYGNTIHMRYQIKLSIGSESQTIYFDDWQYRINEKMVLNKITMKKWGIKVGEIFLALEKSLINS